MSLAILNSFILTRSSFYQTSLQRTTLLTLDEEDVGRHMVIDELRTALRTQPMRYISIKVLKVRKLNQTVISAASRLNTIFVRTGQTGLPCGAALGTSGRFLLGAWGRGVSQDAFDNVGC